MPAEVVRRVRLPADRRAPAAARAVVRSVLVDVDLTELMDEALLLTTELATNGVLHAGTDLDLEIAADEYGITVTVLDQAPGPLDTRFTDRRREAPVEPAERGRGLQLVDHFASRWGTTHHPKGKGVWFRLDRPGHVHHFAGTHGAGALSALLAVAPDVQSSGAVGQFATALLHCLAEQVKAVGGAIRLDRADGSGARTVARYGRQVLADEAAIRLPLPVSRPWSGELEIAAPVNEFVAPLAGLVAERLGLYLENERLRLAELRRETWLTYMAEASELLAQSLDIELTVALIPRLVVPRLGQWCAVHLIDEWGAMSLAAATHADETATPDLLDSLGTAADELRAAADTTASVPLGAGLDGFAFPLVARGQRLGVLSAGRHADHRQDPGEMSILEDIARRAALALDNARIHFERRRVAHMLQQSLLPPALPEITGVDVAAEYVPTGDEVEVGGDFYDVVEMPDGRWLFVIGDVSGKGVQAATVTGLVRDVIRVLVADGRSLPAVLATVNETLGARGGGRYCTLALAAVGRALDGALDVTLHLAGHDRPVLVDAAGHATFPGSGGTALGLLDTVSSPQTQLRLAPGDTLVFYTDGVTERRRGAELYGPERLRTAAAPLAGYPAGVVAAQLRGATLAFSAEAPRDDIAILVLRNEARAA